MATLVNDCAFLASTGTGNFTYASTVQGCVSPSDANVVAGKKYRYKAQSADGSQFEFGLLTCISSTTFSRQPTYTTSGTTVNFTAAPTVMLTVGADDILAFDDYMSLTVNQKAIARNNLGVGVHGTDVASAATTNLQTATGDVIDVTGTTTITAITLNDGEERTVRFTGALTLTNNTSIILPGAASIATQAGDWAVFRGYPSGVTRCVFYQRANLAPIDGGAWLTSSGSAVFVSGSGTYTMRYRLVGKVMIYTVRLSCTATGQLSFIPVPIACYNSGFNYTSIGREIARTGIIWFLQINAVNQLAGGTYANGLASMNTGDIIDFNGIYEVA